MQTFDDGGRQVTRESTFIMVKPDGVRRGLAGEVISRLEAKGLRPERMEMRLPDRETAAVHYAEHRGKPFYESLLEFITSGPAVIMEWSGPSAVAAARALMGATDPVQAGAGTIRGDFGLDVQENIVHGSDSPASAERELAVWFPG